MKKNTVSNSVSNPTGKGKLPMHHLFDMTAGTSSGSLVAASLSY